jgi:hypothetical protein
MERTLEMMEEELRLAEEEKKPLSEAMKVINKKIGDIEDEIEAYKLNNGLYHPMSELANYIGKEISNITLVERNEDGTLSVDTMYNDDMFSVDKNGRLDYSSYNFGVMSYDEKVGKYAYYCHYCRKEHDYVGYLEIEFEDD